MSARYEIHSVCECQAQLGADLDEHHNVVHGWASVRGVRETAPANTVDPSSERFDVVWQCPLCGRNTLRTFYAGALTKKPVTDQDPPADDGEQASEPATA